jgi:folate-binding protein YgfZ
MNSDWNDLLQNSGGSANETGNGARQFSFANADTADCKKMPLTHLGVIKVTGEDRETFLQGQLTNDVRNINPATSQLTSYCTPKGRMLANFRIFSDNDDNWFIVIPSERLAVIFKRLCMFVLRSKVELTDVSNEVLVMGLAGDCIAQALQSPVPAAADEVSHHDSISFIRVETNEPRFMTVGNANAIMRLWQQLESVQPANSDLWRLGDIKAAIPTVFETTQEAFIPQMTNMQLINGVSFTKGCYTGQEVVARMQYLGKLKRRMYKVRFEFGGDVQPGDDIYSSNSKSGQGAGKLVDAIKTDDGYYEGLAVMEISSAEEGETSLFDENGPLLSISVPPYDFETEQQD